MNKKVGQIIRESQTENVKTGVQGHSSVFLVSYSKVSAHQMSEFRKGLKKQGARVAVAKNSIAKIALKDLEYEGLSNKVEGQTALVWGNEDSVEIAKILTKFTKECEGMIIQAGIVNNAILEKTDVQRLADLPSKDVLRAQVLGIIIAPLTRLLGAFNAKSRDLLSILKQYSEKKGGN